MITAGAILYVLLVLPLSAFIHGIGVMALRPAQCPPSRTMRGAGWFASTWHYPLAAAWPVTLPLTYLLALTVIVRETRANMKKSR